VIAGEPRLQFGDPRLPLLSGRRLAQQAHEVAAAETHPPSLAKPHRLDPAVGDRTTQRLDVTIEHLGRLPGRDQRVSVGNVHHS
jgi:hypothetical protein